MSKDTQGELAESLATLLLTYSGVSFRVKQIGGKWPTIDLYAEVDDAKHPGIFCFFQVKSTTLGKNKKGLLQVKVKRDAIRRLGAYLGPTYLIGVDYDSQSPQLSPAYVIAVQGGLSRGVSNMPLTHPLNSKTLATLKEDVIRFWGTTDVAHKRSSFQSNLN